MISCIRVFNLRLLSLLLGLLLLSPAVKAQPVFNCSPTFYQVLSGVLNEYDPTTGTYNPVGPDHDNYNAMGYNSEDGFIYAMRSGRVWRIDAAGNVTDLGPPTATDGSTSTSSNYAGDVDDAGFLWTNRGGNSVVLNKIDVSAMTYEEVTFTGPTIRSADFVFIRAANGDPVLYGTRNQTLYIANTATLISSTKIVAGLPNGTYGATYTDGSGRLYVSNNSGGLYLIANYDQPNPYAVQIASTAASGANDGASCRDAESPFDADISVEKSVSGLPQWNGSHYDVTFDLVVTNTATIGLGGLDLIDDVVGQLGDGLVGINAQPTIQNTGGASTLPTINPAWINDTTLSMLNDDGNLLANESFTVSFTVQMDPTIAGAAAEYTNTVVVSADDPLAPDPPGSPPDNGASSAVSDEDSAIFDLRGIGIEKSDTGVVDAASGVLGNFDITYVFTVTNLGSRPISNLSLSDDWANQFGAAFVKIIPGSVSVSNIDATTPPLANASYAGGAAESMISGGALDLSEGFRVSVVVEVDPDAEPDVIASGQLVNQAVVRGDVKGGGTVEDLSDDPDDDTDVDSEDDGDPDDPTVVKLDFLEYDLALIKEQSAISETPANLGTQVSYKITVMNQGNVVSGSYTVDEIIPAGMTFVSATPTPTSDPGVGNTGTVQWVVAQSDELDPAGTTSFEVVLEVADVTESPYHNIAEITADSSAPYGGDDDSVAGDGSGAVDTINDTDISTDNDAEDEDDSDFEDLKVRPDYDLALIKQQASLSATPATFATQVTYEITVMNQGNVPSGSYTVDDAIPAGLTFVSATPAASIDPGVGNTGAVQWVVAVADELAPGEQTTFEIVLEVADVTLSPYHNTAEISADGGAPWGGDNDSDPTNGSGATDTFDDSDVTNDNDPGDEDDSDFADLEVTPEYDLALIKQQSAISATPATLGTQVTYAITVMNQGNVPSGSYTVDEAIPAGLTFVSATPAATVDPGVGNTGAVQWVVATADELGPTQQTTFEIVLEVADVTLSPYHNTAEISADSGATWGGDDDSDPLDGSGATDTVDDTDVTNDNDVGDEDDSDFADLEVEAEYDLALIKEQVSLSTTPATLGTQATYEITVMNQGNVPSGSFTVDDAIPAGLTFVSATPAATVDPGVGSTGLVQWQVASVDELAPGAQTTFEIVLEVADVTLSPYHNIAEISADSGVSYGGDSDSDPTDGSGASDTIDDSDVTNDNEVGDEDDSDFADLEVAPEYDLALIKEQVSLSATPASLGTQVTYEITVMNQGNVPSGSFNVDDAMPAGLTFVSATPAATVDPGVGSTGAVQWQVTAADELAPGAQTTFEIVLEVADVTLSPYHNTAEISADSGESYGGDSDSDPADGSGASDTIDDSDVTNDNDPGDEDDSDFADLEVTAEYDLALIKQQVSLSTTPANLGTQVTYEITVMNQGNVPSGSFTIDDAIPAGLTFVSATPVATVDPGVGGSGAVQWTVPSASELAAGAQTTFEIVLEVNDVTLSPYHNTAEISADSGAAYGGDSDSDPSDGSGATDTIDDSDVTNDNEAGDEDDSDFADLEVAPEYDLALIKEQVSVSSTPTSLGTQVTYEITVMNQGNVPSGSFTVTDAIPSGLTFASATPAATVDPGVGATGAVQWQVAVADQLAPGALATFEIVLEVADVTLSPYHNTAEISADSGAAYGGDSDSDPADGSGATDTIDDSDVSNDNESGDEDDSDFADLAVAAEYDLALIKEQASLSATPANLGTQVTYEITVMNQGNVPSGSFSVDDAIPSGLTFVSATPAATIDPGAGNTGLVQWQVAVADELAPGQQDTFEIVLEVADVTVSPYHNTAEISADSGASYGGDSDSDPSDGSGATDTIDDSDVTNDNEIGDEDDSDFADLAVVAEYDLALIKQQASVSATPVTLGTQVSYEITVMNQGNVPSGSFNIDDAIPAGMTFVSATPAASVDPGVASTGPVQWQVAAANELAPGEQRVFEIVLEVADVALSPYHNTAEISSDSGASYGGDSDSAPGDGSGATDTIDDSDVTNDNEVGDEDDSDFADLAVVAEYDLALIKEQVTASSIPANLGTQVTYEITVMNQGNVPSGSFDVDDAIPAGLTFVSATPAAAIDPGVGNTGPVRWQVAAADELVPGQQTTFEIVLEVADVTASPYHNTAEISADSGASFGGDSDSDPSDGSGATDTIDDSDVTNDNEVGDEDDSDFADLEVVAEYDLALIKQQVSASSTPANLGTQVTYEITVMNQGNVPSGLFTIDDAVPAGLTFVSATPTATVDPGVGGTGLVQWQVAASDELAPGQQAAFQIVLEVADVTMSPYHNTAEISADSGASYGGDSDSDPSDGSGATDTIDDSDVTNDNEIGDEDDSDFADLAVVAEYDLALIKQQASVSSSPANLGTQVRYEITVMNQGNVPSGSFSVDDAIPAGLTFVSATPAASVNPGVGNTGPVQWQVSAADELAPGQQRVFEIVLEVADVTLSPYHNTAEISADSGAAYGGDSDSDPSDGSAATDTIDDSDVSNDNEVGDEDDSDFADLEVVAEYDLALIKEQTALSATPANLGTQVTYEITVMNQGNVPSGAFSVDDAIPAGMTFVSATPAAATDPGVGSTGPVQWQVAAANELAPGQQTTFQIVLEVADVTLSPYHNTAEISADSGAGYGGDSDSDPSDGSASTDTIDDSDVSNDNEVGDEDDSDFADLEVVAEYDLALIKEQTSASAVPANLGTQVTYEITVMNQGNVPSGSFNVDDAIPSGLTFVSATPAATIDPGAGSTGLVQWQVAVADELAPGQQAAFQIVLEVADVTASPYHNTAEISLDSGAAFGGDSDSDPSDGSASTDTIDDSDVTNDNEVGDEDDSDFADIEVIAEYDLALIKQQVATSSTPANLGTQVTYEITVMNQGNVPSGSFSIDDAIPAGLTFVSATPAATIDPGVGGTGPVQWQVAAANELAPAQQTTFQIVLEVADVTLSPYHNTAEVSADSGAAYGGDSDSDPGDGSASTDTIDDSDVTNDNEVGDEDDSDFADLEVIAEYDLALIKEQVSMTATPANLGTQVTYEITVMNQGNVPSGSFNVDDAIPAGLTFVSATPVATVDPGVGSTGPVRWQVAAANELAPGQQTTFQIVLEIADVTLSPYHNTAEISADSGAAYGGDSDSDPSDGSAATDTIDDSDVSNDNEVGDEDDSDFADLEVVAEYDLALIKEQTALSATPANLGTQVTYEITVMNQGNVPSGSFNVDDAIPAGLTFVSASPAATSGPGVGGTGPVQWQIAPASELAPGEQTTFEIVLEVVDVTLSPYHNTAEISADSSAPYGGDDDSVAGDGSGSSDTIDDSDVTNDNEPGDEDDSDFADLEVIAEYDLALIKQQSSTSSSPPTLGTQVTYDITVMNQGNVPSSTFTVVDSIPAGLTFVSATPAAAIDPGVGNTGNVSWIVSSANELAPGAQTVLSLVLEVADVTQSPYHNTAEISADSGAPYGGDDDSDPADGSAGSDTIDDTDVSNDNEVGDEDDSDFADLEVEADYDLALIKQQSSVSANPATLGTQVSYEITVMNQGNVPSGAFSVSDVIPNGLTFVSASPAATTDPGVGNGGSVSWNVTSANALAPAAQTVFTIVLEVADVTASPYHNIAEISADSSAPYGGDDDSEAGDGSGATDTIDDSDVTNDNDAGDQDDSDFADLEVEADYDLALIKQQVAVSQSPPTLGTQVSYEITVMNQGNVPSGSFSVTDAIPAGLTFVSASPAASTDPGVGSGGDVIWNVATAAQLAPGAQTVFTVVLEVADVTLSPYHNTAEISSDSGAPWGGDDDSKPANGSAASDTFDDADVTNDNDPGDEDDSDFADFEVASDYDLALIKQQVAVSETPPTLGTQVTYDITVMNQGNVPSGTFTVSDAIPAGMTFVSATPSASADPGVGSGGNVSWVVPVAAQLAPSAQTVFKLVLEVSDVTLSPYHNTAQISADDGDDADSDPTDNSASSDTFDDSDVTNDFDPADEDDSDFADFEVASSYDLALIKEQTALSATPATLGTQVTYEITVMNQGNVPSGAYGVTDVIPAGMTFVSATPAASSDPGVGANGSVSWQQGAASGLAPGAQAVFQLVLEVSDVTQSPYHNIAEISSDDGAVYGGDEDSDPLDGSAATDTFDDSDVTNDNDPGDQDDSDFADLEVDPIYDIALIKQQTALSQTPATLGTQVTYQITVMNQGNVPSGSIEVEDIIPAGLSFVSATPAPTVDPGAGNTGTVGWTIPAGAELAPTEQTTFSIVLEVTDVTLSPYHNVAQVSADSGAVYGGDKDSDPSDNSGTTDTFDDEDVSNDQDPGDSDDSDFADLEVAASYDLALIKQLGSVTPSPANLGSTATFSITVMNQGNVPSGSFTVDDVIPAGMSFVSATPAATTDPGAGANGTVSWVIPAASGLAPGAQANFTVELSIDDVTLSPYHNVAEISADDGAAYGGDRDSDASDGSALTDTFDDDDVTNDSDPGDQDDSDFADLEVQKEYDLALVKTVVSASPSPANVGSQVTFEITVMNQGNVPSGAFSVTDTLPSAMTFVSALPLASTAPAVGSTGNVSWSVPAASGLAPGAVATFQLVASIDGGPGSVVKNIAEIMTDDSAAYGGDSDSVAGDGSGTADTFEDVDYRNDQDPDDQDDSDFATVEIPGTYDLSLIKAHATNQNLWVSKFQLVRYVITVKNNGDIPSGTFSVVDSIPGGMIFHKVIAPQFSCANNSPSSGKVKCTYKPPHDNALPPGGVATIRITLRVMDPDKAPFRNWAEITEDAGEDVDSTPNSNGDASDPGGGVGNIGTDPVTDHDEIDHTGIDHTVDEDDSDFAENLVAQTTPITLQSFEAVDVDGAGGVEIRWRTSMEDGNAGFYLYARKSGGSWARVHQSMIPATATSDAGAAYSQMVDAAGKDEFALTDVDLFGAEIVHGPYKLGQVYGTSKPVAELDQTIAETETESPVVASPLKVYLDTDSAGVHRVTYGELKAAGYDFQGQPVADMALSVNGEAVPVRVEGARDKDDPYSSSYFGRGGFIEFVATKYESFYSRSNRYLLSVDPAMVARFDTDYAPLPDRQTRASRIMMATRSWAPDVAYSRVSPIEDPWYADKITTFKKEASRDYPMRLKNVLPAQPARLRMRVWSSYDDPDVGRDHHIVVYVNGARVGSRKFAGISAASIDVEIPANVLTRRKNVVTVKLPMRGRRKLGQIYVESIEIDYMRPIIAESGSLDLQLENAVAVDVAGLRSRDVSVYRQDDTGFYRSRASVQKRKNGFLARLSGVAGNASWHVADQAGRKAVKFKAVPTTSDLLRGSANYLAIAHPRFMTADLDRLLAARQAEGHSTKLVDIRKIYAAYSNGYVDPEAIRAYLKDAAGQLGVKYVLLVGGATYDPLNNLKQKRGRAISFIPTLYAQTGQAVKHAPVDPLLGDIDKDGVPDLMLGRLAVQSKSQLSAVVNKILVYPYASHGGRAVVVSDDIDESSSRSFSDIADKAIAALGPNWSVEHFSLEDMSLKRVNQSLQDRINSGTAITAWVGHSDRDVWGFDGVLTSDQVGRLNNVANPTVVMQWGCWNNYYVDPRPVSMTYKWLLTPERGAVASIGSTTLMEAGSEEIMAAKMFEKLAAGMTLGEALFESKKEMADQLGLASIRDLLGGLVILGDPAMRPLVQ